MSRTVLKDIVVAAMLPLSVVACSFSHTRTVSDSDPQVDGLFFYAGPSVPVGEFKKHANLGGGFGAGFRGSMSDYLTLRNEMSVFWYGRESDSVSGTHRVISAGIGPEIYLGTRSVRPYLYGTGGFSYFTSDAGVRRTNDADSVVSVSDWGFAFAGGGGLSVRLGGRGNPMLLGLSAGYEYNGATDYLNETAYTIRRQANRITFRMLLGVGF